MPFLPPNQQRQSNEGTGHATDMAEFHDWNLSSVTTQQPSTNRRSTLTGKVRRRYSRELDNHRPRWRWFSLPWTPYEFRSCRHCDIETAALRHRCRRAGAEPRWLYISKTNAAKFQNSRQLPSSINRVTTVNCHSTDARPSWLIDWLGFYIPLDTKYVMSETFFPANLLASKN